MCRTIITAYKKTEDKHNLSLLISTLYFQIFEKVGAAPPKEVKFFSQGRMLPISCIIYVCVVIILCRFQVHLTRVQLV